MICFPPQLFPSTGEMFVALHANSKYAFECLGYVWEPITGRYANRSYNISAPELMPYNLHILTSDCKEWDPKRQSWDSINCEMDWFPSQHILECTCRPAFGLTFGNTFYVAPNRIDFSTVFLRFDITNQGPVIGTLITILVIYVLLLIWARQQDKRDIAKVKLFTPLIDNFVDDTYYYLVTVYTGMRRGAGTKSKIGFIIHGQDGDTGIRELADGVRTNIPAASVVHFLMSTPYPLGDLSYVYIWHDNSGVGKSSSWYLTRVDVEDLQTRERFVFLCGKWLSLDTFDSSVDAVLPVCGKENVTTFSNMFYLNIKENLADNHMWISIFFRPTSSHYTRCQRLTCFLLFIVLTMIGNAIYFRDEDEFSNAGSDIHVGPFSFTLSAIYIALISALISTPTTVLVIFMFSKSMHRKSNTGDSSRRYRVPILDVWLDRVMADSHKLEKALVSKGLFITESTIFPYWFQYIAWILALAGVALCSFFLTLYSIEWGKNKSQKWLAQFSLSFFSSICLLDPLKIRLVNDYIKWLRYTAFPELYPETDYTGERLHWRLRQYFNDLTSFRVGPPRLRQLRVTESSEVHPFLGSIRTRPKYYLPVEENRDFCFGWISGICDKISEARSFSYGGWTFTSAIDIWGIPIPGRYNTYGGGGYITELAVNLDFSNRTLNELTDFLWIDRNTRVVYLEFNLYAPDLNLFAYNMFVAEFPETGGIITSYSIYPFRIYFHHGTNGIYTLICEIIFLLILVALTGMTVSRITKKRKTYFKSVWNILDCCCISLSFVCISMYAGRHILASQTLEKFKADPKQFINFQHIVVSDLLFNLLHATLLSLATLRLVGILGYDIRVGKIFMVFDKCAKDLFWFGIFMFYLFLCYAALGYLLFGKYIESYCDIFESMGTLFISMIGKSKFKEINEKDPILSQFYFFTFILLIVFTLLTIFMAILGESISAVQTMNKGNTEEELINRLWKKIKNVFVKKSDTTKNSKKQPFQNTSIDILYDVRKAFNDSDDYNEVPPVTTNFKKKTKRIFDTNS
ncbi:uncharacterized protein LOC134726311 [Mytilus trossulus]|uniref:uncharacterized protein LOC134726311 n=1 Tax=Mytilus trossulus TaxID=6551 RepID=UPI00300411B7